MKISSKLVLLMAAFVALPSLTMARPRVSASTKAMLRNLPETKKAQLRAMNAKRLKEIQEIRSQAISKSTSMDATAKAELRAATISKIKATNQRYIQEARTLINQQ